ncbi:hypothetical protein OG762_44255 [Streptomyces sp. NBC_01136]|uniref:hypothetical protein n=1 Tax=unclassified Streptomyces TaxID=2593676 RepID=UPI003254A9B1|nr:hypothetical protein OG762_44255 [Streptomyces sp. NBC_01136]
MATLSVTTGAPAGVRAPVLVGVGIVIVGMEAGADGCAAPVAVAPGIPARLDSLEPGVMAVAVVDAVLCAGLAHEARVSPAAASSAATALARRMGRELFIGSAF